MVAVFQYEGNIIVILHQVLGEVNGNNKVIECTWLYYSVIITAKKPRLSRDQKVVQKYSMYISLLKLLNINYPTQPTYPNLYNMAGFFYLQIN